MADKQTDNTRFEQFKLDVLAWKEAHRDEYNRFSRMMAESDGMEFVMLYRFCSKLLPAYAKEWKRQWSGEGTMDFDRFDAKVQSSKLAKVWVDRFHYHKEDMTANLVLSWMLFGRSYETKVTLLEGYANDEKNGRIIRTICARTIKYIISSSIKSGYRTREQWDEFQSEQQMLQEKDATGWAMKDIAKTAEIAETAKPTPKEPEEVIDAPEDTPSSVDDQPRPLRASSMFNPYKNIDSIMRTDIKQAMHMEAAKSFGTAEANENERRWERERFDQKNQDPTNHYDITRQHLNFEIGPDGKIHPLGYQEKSLEVRLAERLNQLSWHSFKEGSKNQPNMCARFIFGGNHDRTLQMAFGNQTVCTDKDADNSHLHRCPEIERWALDVYDWCVRRHGRENIIGFQVHLQSLHRISTP